MDKLQKTLKAFGIASLLIVLFFTTMSARAVSPQDAPLPQEGPGAASLNFTAISAGGSHTCALTTSGGVKCWGDNHWGQLGDGTTVTQRSSPVSVSGLTSGVTAVSVGNSHTCALTASGGVKCWGYNYTGELGDGTNLNSNTPVDVLGLSAGVIAISAGGSHTCAITTSGGVKCWGVNGKGQLGNGTNTNINQPLDVTGLTGSAALITTGNQHTCVLTDSSGVKCWGLNDAGQLGDGTNTNSNLPVDVSSLTSGISAISAGKSHTCAVTGSGGALCWGAGGTGQLGNGALVNTNSPVAVTGLDSGVAAISAGGQQTCALTSSAGVQCWGNNSSGGVGDGTTTLRTTPVDVLGLTSGVASITTGRDHSCALPVSGGAKCWGDNWFYQLGDGTDDDRTSPVDVHEFPPVGFFRKIRSQEFVSTTVTLSWGIAENASSYEYCYDTTNDNDCTDWVSVGPARSATLTGLVSGNTYYWQVRGLNANSVTYADFANYDTYYPFTVDGVPPKVLSITTLDPNPSSNSMVRFKVKFSEPIPDIPLDDFSVTTTGIPKASVYTFSGSGTAVYIVYVSTGSGAAKSIRLNVIDNDRIKDMAGNPLGGPGVGNGNFLSGPRYTMYRRAKFYATRGMGGWVIESQENSGVGGKILKAHDLVVGDHYSNEQSLSILYFDTARLPDNAIVRRVTLNMLKNQHIGTDPYLTHRPLLIDIKKGFFGSSAALEAADFQAMASMKSVGELIQVKNLIIYQALLRPAAYPFINLTGPTQFRLRFALDDNNDNGQDVIIFSAGIPFEINPPELVVDYILP